MQFSTFRSILPKTKTISISVLQDTVVGTSAGPEAQATLQFQQAAVGKIHPTRRVVVHELAYL